jgi:hypothetical protein
MWGSRVDAKRGRVSPTTKNQVAQPREVPQRCFDVELRPDGIVWLKRTLVAYEASADVDRAYDEFLKVVDDWVLERRITSGQLGTRKKTPIGWLCDIRSAPAQRNDPEFEGVIQRRRPDLLKRSPFLVVLVKTAAGRMQLNRITKDDKSKVRLSVDFYWSIEWLRKQITAVSTPTDA